MEAVIRIVIGVGAGLGVLWIALIIGLLIAKPEGSLVRESLRILPDTIVLLRRLAIEQSLPRRVRARLWLLFVYLAIPIDLVPDFVPVLGYADDAIIVAAVLRSVVRAAGIEPVERLWPGTPDGLGTLRRLAKLNSAGPGSS